MDEFVAQLFSYIPEKWRPYLAILLLILYVVTKIRSHQKSAQLTALLTQSRNKTLGIPITEDFAFEKRTITKLGKLTNLFLNVLC